MNELIRYSQLVLIVTLGFWTTVYSQTSRPPYPTNNYSSKMWRGQDPEMGALFLEDAWPDTGLFTDMVSGPSEPGLGYPYHSSHITRVSDTITLWVYLYNETGESISIMSEQPELWVEPYVYEYNVDVRNSNSALDTSSYHYRFSHWQAYPNHPKEKPDSLLSRRGSHDRDVLVYYCWGLPPGRWRVILHESSSAPSGFKALATAGSNVWVTKPKVMADTLNAFVSTFWRVADTGNYTSSMSWTDSILAYNPTSMVAYRLKAHAYDFLGDTLSITACLDSVIAIAERYGDPVLPDSVDMDKYQRFWYKDMLSAAKFHRWVQDQPNKFYIW